MTSHYPLQVLTRHVAFVRSTMIAVAAGSVDLRNAHRVAGNQACGDAGTSKGGGCV